MAEPRHPERLEQTWPHYEDGDDHAVRELAAEYQGADPPYGQDVHPPLNLERHGRHFVVREEGTERADTDF